MQFYFLCVCAFLCVAVQSCIHLFVVCRLLGCQVTEEGCLCLNEALRSERQPPLKELDLSYNHPGANGIQKLTEIAEDQDMSLVTLWYVEM